MVFSLGKIFLSDQEIILFKCFGTNDIMLQYKLHNFLAGPRSAIGRAPDS